MQGLAFTQGSAGRGVTLTIAYCLGLGMPFILFGLGLRRFLGALAVIRRHSLWVTRVGGGMLVVVGLAAGHRRLGRPGDLAVRRVRHRRGGDLMSTVDQRPVEPETPTGTENDAQLSTQPAPDAARRITGRGIGSQLLRWWRQLTSMRTALLLLFLLAIAAVPGSMLPQRGLNPLKVDDYFAAHPKLAPFLDRLSAFDVFAAPWFAAIYLLLFVSLIGCLVPRMRLHARALWRRPPEAPRHLDRLPVSETLPTVATAPEALAQTVRATLRRKRWRSTVRIGADGTVTVSAEKGYLRETGNLLFHFALVAVLAGVALGGLWGWKASILVTEGDEFCNTVQAYDQFMPGRLVGDATLPPFCVALDDFRATYLDNGQPKDYRGRRALGRGRPHRRPAIPTGRSGSG